MIEPINTSIDTQLPTNPTPIASPTPVIQSIPPRSPLLPIFIGISVITLGAAGYFGYKYFQVNQKVVVTPSPTPTEITKAESSPTPDPTADWKTYASEKYNFEIRYPNNWTVDGICGEDKTKCIGTELHIKSPDSHYPDGEFTIEILDSSCGGFNSQSWSKPVTKSSTIIDKKEGLQITGKLDFNDDQLHDVKNICIPNGGRGYLFRMWSLNNQNDVKTYDQILSTFKFTESKNEDAMGTISGNLCYPSDFLPPGEIEAKNSTGKIFTQTYPGSTNGGGPSYSLSVPAGTYKIRYNTHPNPKEPNLSFPIYYTQCAKETDKCGNDSYHNSLTVTVKPSVTATGIDLCDGYWSENHEPEF